MLAIVIPYYKFSFFEKTLQSLSKQTDKRFKVYIGNDASPENPKQLLDVFSNSFHFDYTVFENNLGKESLVKQWERCLDLMQDEDWLMILGDDDTLSEDCIELFYQNIEKVNLNKCNVVRFATKVIDEEDKSISPIHVHPEIENSVDFLFRRIKGGTRSSLSEYVFKTVSVKKNGFKNFPLAWHTDDLAILEFSEFGNIYTINDTVVNFRLSGENITSKNDNLKLKNKATFSYYHYLLSCKKSFFNDNQKNILFFKLEKSLLNDKKNVYFWMKLIQLYLSNFKFSDLLVLVFKAISMGFRSKNNFL